eukprot:scaffold69828_cov45-Prasinocladus_malaysianus.AAC.1
MPPLGCSDLVLAKLECVELISIIAKKKLLKQNNTVKPALWLTDWPSKKGPRSPIYATGNFHVHILLSCPAGFEYCCIEAIAVRSGAVAK